MPHDLPAEAPPRHDPRRPRSSRAVRRLCLLAVLILLLPAGARPRGSSGEEGLDVLIANARVFDGSGNPWRYLDVGIHGDRIAWVGRRGAPAPPARRRIDASGLYLSPGFIDLHTHTAAALRDPDVSHNKNFLLQGVTTLVTGNDGGGPWSVREALEQFEEVGIGPNALLLAGHGTVRREVLGMEDRAPDAADLERMRDMVRQAMSEGAFGLSTGLYYAPGSYAATEEVVELARVVAEFGGYYDSHIRDESDYTVGLSAAVDEVIRIGREAGLRVHISHIKALGAPVWGLSHEVVERIESARREGIEVTADQYPYEASSTGLTGALIPRWALAGGREQMLRRFADREERRRVLQEVETNIRRRGGPHTLHLSAYVESSLVGRTLEEIAAERNRPPAETVLDLLEVGNGSVVSFNMQEEDIRRFMRREWVATASDGSTVPFGEGRPHPRGYGTFPRKVRTYVLEERVIDLAFAVRAATSLPASVAGIPDRGWVKEGYYADLLLFDLDRFRDRATFDSPHQYSEGVVYLFVNGVAVVEEGRYDGRLPGRALRHGAR